MLGLFAPSSPAWRARARRLPTLVLFLVVASCSGGGCGSGCSGCASVTPLSTRFDVNKRIENGASARITASGLAFLQANLATLASGILGKSGGALSFSIAKTTATIAGLTATICPNGGDPTANPKVCTAEIDLSHANLQITTATPSDLHLTGTLPLRVQDLEVNFLCANLNVAINGDGACPGGAMFDALPADVDVDIHIDDNLTHSGTLGYTQVTINKIVDSSVVTTNLDSSLHICGLPSCNAACCITNLCTCAVAGIASALQTTIVGLLSTQLQNAIQSLVDDQVCAKASSTSPCPNGTVPDANNVCRFGDGTCPSILVGTDGHLNVGSALASVAPGASGSIDFMLAAGGLSGNTHDPAARLSWGDLDPIAGGATLGLYGGAEPSPVSGCVPAVTPAPPLGIPIPDELFGNTVTPWSQPTGPDLGVAIAGRFIQYAATSIYSSGALCLGLSTDQFPALATGYVSVVVPSIKELTFEPGRQSGAAAIAIATRPTSAPVVTLGGGTDIKKDPLISLALPSFAIDFYVWSLDRYVRVFTYTSDVTIPIDLQTGQDPKTNPNGGIVPVLGDLTTDNGVITNSSLLWETPQALAPALSSLLGGIVGNLLGKGFSPINLNGSLKSLGLSLDLPADAFRKLHKGTDDYIGLFGNLTTQPTGMVRAQVELLGTEIHPEAMGFATADRAKFPKLHVALSSPVDDGSRPIEYTYWIDEQPRAAWAAARDVIIDSQYLFLQGKHTLHAAARIAGHPESEDDDPPQVPFIIDVLPPVATARVDGTSVTAFAYDYVSDAAALTARSRAIGVGGQAGAWTEWRPVSAAGTFGPLPAGSAASIDVQVRDEAGNVAGVTGVVHASPAAAIGAGSAGCGCSMAGSAGSGGGFGLAALGALGALAIGARRRRVGGAAVVGSLGASLVLVPACSCGGGSGAKSDAGPEMNCGAGCDQPCGPANEQGLIGEYTSLAVAPDGTIWMAGYNDADVTNGLFYGDLVAGKYDPNARRVHWVDVDGLPPAPSAGNCPPNPPDTWRHGLTDPGPDVGLWTTMAVDAEGHPMIGYYDATNAALKFASSADGGQTWSTHTVLQTAGSDIGRYAKMLLVDDKPALGFLVLEPGSGGWAQSRVVLATANVAMPAAATDWTLQNALVDAQTPCVAKFCPAGQVCVKATGQCQPSVPGCMPSDCGASEAGITSTPESCVAVDGGASCQAVITSASVGTIPDTTSDYVALAQGSHGIGIVVYDRTRGNLVGISQATGSWQAQILDGAMAGAQGSTTAAATNVGVAASLAIDPKGSWHVSYVNALTYALQYVEVPGGDLAKPGPPEIVDDGLHVPGGTYPDGQHRVGDDSSISLDDQGVLRVVYQDATAGTLHVARTVRGKSGQRAWTVEIVTQGNTFAGFFPHYVSQLQQVENFYRATDHSHSPPLVTGDVAFVGF